MRPQLVTVVTCDDFYAADTKGWMKATIDHFEQHDDVFCREFLEGLIFLNGTKRYFPLAKGCRKYLRETGNKWYRTVPNQSPLNQLKPGPYYLSNGHLRPVYRVFDDTKHCFLTTFAPQTNVEYVTISWRVLPYRQFSLTRHVAASHSSRSALLEASCKRLA